MKIQRPEVAAAFDAPPPAMRRKLLALRRLILETAKATEGVGEIEETLKWGEPSYLTPETKSGSTIRIGWKPNAPKEYALLFHCQTDLIERFRDWYPELTFDGNRRIVLQAGGALPREQLADCIAAALTYHLDKEKRAR